jgi:hypothetical protein
MKHRSIMLAGVLAWAAAIMPLLLPTALASPSWVNKSDELAVPVLEAQLMEQPELLSFVGTPGSDTRIVDWGKGAPDRYRSQMKQARADLLLARRAERSPEVLRDIDAMLESIDNALRVSVASERTQRPWLDAPLRVFQGLQSLLSEQAPPERRALAVQRLRQYLGNADTPSLFKDVQNRYLESADRGLANPSAAEVKQAIARAPLYVKGLRALCERHRLSDCLPLLDDLDREVIAHQQWLQDTVLPEARTEPLPRALYQARLRQAGVDISPEKLIALAKSNFSETQAQMQDLAIQVAHARGWPEHDYRTVIARLKTESLSNDEVVAHYRAVMIELDQIIHRERIVTLPQGPMVMRLGTLAESAAQPAPQFLPAPLFGNKRGAGEFVLPMSNPGGAINDRYDDFNFRAVAWTLSAHEGRPGHELQFARFAEMGLPMARTILSYNSVNAEGWALYAEAEMMPYQPLDAQLITLQFRLLRAARAFLDPQLQLGQITRSQAEHILRNDVGISAPMAQQELDRYQFKMVGQAPSYFYGYWRMMKLRKIAEAAWGDKFDRLAFNDFIIAQGMASPKILEAAVHQEFAPR